MRQKLKLSSLATAISSACLFAALTLTNTASAHTWQIGWKNTGSGLDFYGLSYHSLNGPDDDFGGTSLSGLVINGTPFQFDFGSAVGLSNCNGPSGVAGTCDATWNALALEGAVAQTSSYGYSKYAVASLDPTELASIGIVGGTNSVTLNGYGNSDDWAPWPSGPVTASVSFAPVPEPGTLALLSLGLAGLAAARRRRR